MVSLQPFQKHFIRGAMASGINPAALTMPKGNGKSWLAAYIAAEELKHIQAHQEIAISGILTKTTEDIPVRFHNAGMPLERFHGGL